MPPTASELLTAWERAAGAPAGRRALELAVLARPDLAEQEREALTVGERDAALLDLRQALFGPTLDAVLECPGCGETLELAPAVDELRAESPPSSAGERTLAHDGSELRFRQPTALDVAEVANEADARLALERLLERCLIEATVEGRAVTRDALPAEAIAALDDALAASDPQADVELDIECPGCGERSATRFDVASFLWSELERFVLGTLREIHVLASTYGWSESQILELGTRRRLYLELIER